MCENCDRIFSNPTAVVVRCATCSSDVTVDLTKPETPCPACGGRTYHIADAGDMADSIIKTMNRENN